MPAVSHKDTFQVPDDDAEQDHQRSADLDKLVAAGMKPIRLDRLHISQPLSHRPRIKSHTSPHPERRYPSRGSLLEDRDPGHGEEPREFLSGQRAADLLDLICN
jgi:hypothetical protein